VAEYRLTIAATEDLDEIRKYLRKRSLSAAKKVDDELRRAFHILAESPRIGHFREDLDENQLRFWTVYSYSVIYRPEAGGITVIRVLHAAQDIRAILAQDPYLFWE
jgi:plasmid stabilization system protein ParE